MIRILVADDHPIIREGIKFILAGEADIQVADEAETAQETLDKARKKNCDLLLLDISMPGRQGLEVLSQLKSEFPRLAVLILSAHPEEEYAVRCLKAGASGYLTKGKAPEELITAIRKVAGGGRFVSESLGEWLASHLGDDFSKPLHDALTDREFFVLRGIASGKTVTDIAEELSLSVKTVSTYRTRLLIKMKMRNNAELIHYGVVNRLID
jgi:DNA-binding NarL/FixJ family response regulator